MPSFFLGEKEETEVFLGRGREVLLASLRLLTRADWNEGPTKARRGRFQLNLFSDSPALCVFMKRGWNGEGKSHLIGSCNWVSLTDGFDKPLEESATGRTLPRWPRRFIYEAGAGRGGAFPASRSHAG